MGNICGCVRGPKEECYVDPKKAPLKPGSKELKGRRYFQRKKRKSVDLQQRRPEIQARGGSDGSGRTEVTAPSAGWEIHSQSDCDGRVVALMEDPPAEELQSAGFQPDRAPAGGSLDEKLHGTRATSWPARDGLLARKLLRRQLRRAVSFGAVEHMLRSLRGDGASGSEDAFAKIIWSSQAHRRRRRRASVCSGYPEHPPAPAKCHSIPRKVKVRKKEMKVQYL